MSPQPLTEGGLSSETRLAANVEHSNPKALIVDMRGIIEETRGHIDAARHAFRQNDRPAFLECMEALVDCADAHEAYTKEAAFWLGLPFEPKAGE